MKQFFILIGRLLSFLYPYCFNYRLTLIKDCLYTGWYRKQFRSFAIGSRISRPLYLNGGKYISIGNDFRSGQGLRLDAFDNFGNENFKPEIIIGNNVSIEKYCHIGAINRVIIGNGVLMAGKVYISDHSHGMISSEQVETPPLKRPLVSKGEVIIEDNVWLGEGVVVLAGVTIGQGTIVGAGAVVTKSLPPRVVAVGIPARIIKTL